MYHLWRVFRLNESEYQLQEIITALSDYHERCTICYRHTIGNSCHKCNECYLECTCTPLTPSQIIQGVDM